MMDANEVRSAFTGYFAERGHTVLPSASLIPHDPSVLFTIAGMVPFKPYFLGDEPAPWKRATTVQKCFRTLDIDVVGTTERHCTFFEMLGNFSFGDYFKSEAIPFAWEFVTEVLGIDGDRLWVTVHDSDDEAEEIWADAVGLDRSRIQRMGEDNFWKMGETGPCGPSSEIYFDRGEQAGAAGGPARGGAERFVEIWDLVFMQYNRLANGDIEDLPRRSIDTGAGLERILPVLQGVGSLFATDVMAPVLATAEEATGHRYGVDRHVDVALRILTDHARAMAMLVSDGVLPSNEGRGYVLRRVIRRAVLRAHQLGVHELVTARMVGSVASVLGTAYPKLVEDLDLVKATVEREEGHFLRTLQSGSAILDQELAGVDGVLPGEVAFRLHDTYGFPVELTVELARDAGAEVDMEGFEIAMSSQRHRAREAARNARKAAGDNTYRAVIESAGPSRFVGYEDYQCATSVVAVLAGGDPHDVELVLGVTPFYAESGGQVGDTGVITTETGRAEVTDTFNALPGLIVHRARVSGEIHVGQDALAVIDATRREATRRNHTGTHLLHAALRMVLGDHVRQQGSLVAPDRLRFDFSHHAAVRTEELDEILRIANSDVLSDARVNVTEAARADAEAMGALAFFGDKYGEVVRVVEAGSHSRELCGGTHVDALGMIGPIAVLSESSIGSGTRRIEATTGEASLELLGRRSRSIVEASRLLRVEPAGVIEALDRLIAEKRESDKELAKLRAGRVDDLVTGLVSAADAGAVVARRDGLSSDELRALAKAAIATGGLRAVVIAGTPDGSRAALAVAASSPLDAQEVARALAGLLGGGGGGSRELAISGGRNVAGIDEALAEAARLVQGR